MKKILIISLISFIFIISFILFYRSPHPIHIVYMTDSNYFPYMKTSLYSAIKNKHNDSLYHIHIISKNLTDKEKNEIKKFSAPMIKISFYEAEDKRLDPKHLGRFASFDISLQKLFIADYLNEINKVLYLDSDTIVQDDLTSLYSTPIKEYYAAAVKDGLMYQYPEHIAEIGLASYNFYFNSGVMILNLKKIHQDEMIRKSIIYYNTHNEIFGDQDVLNVVFRGHVRPLSYRYNCNSTFFEEKSADFLSDFYQEQIPSSPTEVYKKAVILHFAGHKPWTEYYTQPYLKALYKQYFNQSTVM